MYILSSHVSYFSINHSNPLRELYDSNGVGGWGEGKKKKKTAYQSKGSNPAISTAAQLSRVNAL